MVAAGYNGAASLTQHLGFPQQPSFTQQPWGASLAAAAPGSAQAGGHSGACSEQLYRMDDPGSLSRRMPPGLEASLATAAEWSSAAAWDASAAPSWLILSACSGRSHREDQAAQAPSANSASNGGGLSPLAQRAADAAVRVAAGLLSPGRWKAPQAVGVSSIAALHNSASLPKNFAPYKSTYKAMSPAKAPLSRSISNGSDEYGRPKKSGGREPPSGTLEGSISALADALNSLEAVTCSDPAKKLDFEPFHQGEFLDAHGELRVDGLGSPEDAGSSDAGGVGVCCSPGHGSLAGAELMDDAFLDSLSSQSSLLLEAGEAPEEGGESSLEEWLSTSSGPVSSAEGNLADCSALPEGETFCSGGDMLGMREMHAPLCTLPELPLEEDAAAAGSDMDGADDVLSEGQQQHEWVPSTPAQMVAGDDSSGEGEERQALSSGQAVGRSGSGQLPSLAPRAGGRILESPFAESCADSPFEAPSPRDMQLSPAEEQLIPAAGLSKDMEPLLKQASGQPQFPVLANRANTEQLLWMPEALPVQHHTLQRSRSAGSCAAQSAARRPGKRLFGIVAQDQSEWQPLLRESSQVMEMVGMDTEWMLNDLLACADAAYA